MADLKPCWECGSKHISAVATKYSPGEYMGECFCRDCGRGGRKTPIVSTRVMAIAGAKELWNAEPRENENVH